MAITTRAGKGSALTHAELDANFTTLGLAHGDANADLDVSSIIVQTSLLAKGTAYNSNTLERYAIQDSQANSGLVSVWLQTDFSDLSAGNNTISDGKGAGAWSQLTIDDGNGSDFNLYTGGIQWKTREVTDLNNYETHCSIHTYTRTGGGPQTAADMLTIGKSETKFENTDRVAMYAPLKLANYTSTEKGSLAAHNGSIIFNTTNNIFEGWDGSSWVDLGAEGSSSFSGSYNDLTDKPTLFDGAYSSLTGTPTIPLALTDLSITDGTTGQVLTTDGAGNFSFTTVSSGTGGGTAYNQSLNTTDDVTFNSVTTDTLITTGTGISEIESATSLTLTTSDGVRIEGGPLRLPTFTTTERNSLVAVDGDVILNTTDNAIQARINGNWVNL
jgi:hypothetical protein